MTAIAEPVYTLTAELAGACRLCSYDAYCVDAEGLPVHPCYVTWRALLGDEWRGKCPACVESRAAKRNRRGPRK